MPIKMPFYGTFYFQNSLGMSAIPYIFLGGVIEYTHQSFVLWFQNQAHVFNGKFNMKKVENEAVVTIKPKSVLN